LKKPVTLRRCGCSFCRECVEATLEGKGIILSQCPACATPVEHRELLDNRLLESLVAVCGRLKLRSLHQHAGTNAANAAGQRCVKGSSDAGQMLQRTANLPEPLSAQPDGEEHALPCQDLDSEQQATYNAESPAAARSAAAAEAEAAEADTSNLGGQHQPEAATAAEALVALSSEQRPAQELAGEVHVISQLDAEHQAQEHAEVKPEDSQATEPFEHAADMAADAEAPRYSESDQQQRQQAADATAAVGECGPNSRCQSAADQVRLAKPHVAAHTQRDCS